MSTRNFSDYGKVDYINSLPSFPQSLPLLLHTILSTIGHLYFGIYRTFLLCLDRIKMIMLAQSSKVLYLQS